MMTPGTSKEDSASLANSFIQNWVKQQTILYKAENNLDEEKKNVNKVGGIWNSLITYIYESELIRQKLDTAVSEQEIEKYRRKSTKFQLKDNTIKVLYLRVKKDAPKIKKVKEWYKSSDPKDRLLFGGVPVCK